MRSPAETIALRLIEQYGLEEAHRKADEFLDQLAITELAAHEGDWIDFWARPKQLPPPGDWLSWGFLGGRGLGKTLAISKYINSEVRAGRAMLVGCAAQDEDNAVKLQITGPSGLIATAAPDFKPEWRESHLELVWPNGARAYVRTPEVPGKIRGLEYHLFWLTEIQSWPNSTRDEAYANVIASTRLGYSRIVWDATPKRRHPILRRLVLKGVKNPSRHVVVRGTTHENPYLGARYIGNLEDELGGTQQGLEEIYGYMADDSDGALVKASWIRNCPIQAKLGRRVVSVDPAVSNRKGSDNTGIVEVGLLPNGDAIVLGDDSGKMDVGRWADIVLDRYVNNGCDLVIAETNKGGSIVAQLLRSAAKDRKLTVVVVGKDERPQPMPGVVNVKEVFARGTKEDRAEPVATAYERGRIWHAEGVNLSSLEDTLTTWEPGPNADSPGDLDALVHACVELLDLSKNDTNYKAGFQGIVDAGKQLAAAPKSPSVSRSFAAVLGGSTRGNRI